MVDRSRPDPNLNDEHADLDAPFPSFGDLTLVGALGAKVYEVIHVSRERGLVWIAPSPPTGRSEGDEIVPINRLRPYKDPTP